MAPKVWFSARAISVSALLTSKTHQLSSNTLFMVNNLQKAHKKHYIQKYARKRVQTIGNGDLK